MKTRILMFAFLVASFLSFTTNYNDANASPAKSPVTDINKVTAVTIPVVGTIDEGGTFTGVYEITRFVTRQGQLFAVGTLSGTLTDAANNVIGTVTGIPVRIPVLDFGTATCTILELHLGPLDLDLLGLHVHLEEVDLVIEAHPGSGNLLGNLLCAVANLLNSGGPLSSIAQLLNQILGQL